MGNGVTNSRGEHIDRRPRRRGNDKEEQRTDTLEPFFDDWKYSQTKQNPVETYLGTQGKPMTIDDNLKDVNPKFNSGDPDFRQNCVLCAYSSEFRRRGYDVEANRYDQDFQTGYIDWHGDVHGNFTKVFGGQTWTKKGELGSRTATTAKNIEKKMGEWGDGARAIITVVWKSGSAHAFNLEQVNGKTVAYDSQNGKKYDLNDILKITQPTSTMISRVDHLNKVNIDYVDIIAKKRGRT